jgi:hypothetical protein
VGTVGVGLPEERGVDATEEDFKEAFSDLRDAFADFKATFSPSTLLSLNRKNSNS